MVSREYEQPDGDRTLSAGPCKPRQPIDARYEQAYEGLLDWAQTEESESPDLIADRFARSQTDIVAEPETVYERRAEIAFAFVAGQKFAELLGPQVDRDSEG